ncbi:MAG TPA: hypothetical protein VH307_18235 [Streptosporangiaceae bacterium]|jgi:hypothetical protein|nr:hypothetical protein [Streptosporangiaceae bacterium]
MAVFWRVGVSAAAAAACLTGCGQVQAGAAGGGGWRAVAVPALRPNSVLNDVAAAGADDAFAVGREGFSADGKTPGAGVVLRWDGRAWTVAYTGAEGSSLSAVAVSSPTDVWALGTAGQGPSGTPAGKLLVVHWDGRSWRTVAFPGTTGGALTAAGGRAWITGRPPPGQGNASLIFGWDGSRWRRFFYPCPGIGLCDLRAVTARTASDAWAVGQYDAAPWPGMVLYPFVLHWDGLSWRAVPALYTARGGQHYHSPGVLQAVATASGHRAWAIGLTEPAYHPLMFGWDGKRWQQLPWPQTALGPARPVPISGQNGSITIPLGGAPLSADQNGQLWLALNNGVYLTYVRFDGQHWTATPGPATDSSDGAFASALAAIPGTTATWCVGGIMVGGRRGAFATGRDPRAHIELSGSINPNPTQVVADPR